MRLFLILIPLIAAINYYLTYTDINLDWFLVITFLLDVQQGYVAWLCVRAIILYMDRTYPFSQHPFRRIVFQALITSVIGVLVIVLQTMLMNWLFSDQPIPTIFFTDFTILFFIWFLVVNGIYIGLHYHTEWRNSEDIREQERAIRMGGYTVRYGKTNLSIPFDDIAGFTIENEYAVLTTMEPRKYYLDESLDAAEKKLPEEKFFRLNRQFIVHRQVVTGFDRLENGKINVLIQANGSFPTSIPVSRLKAPAFKSWFQPS